MTLPSDSLAARRAELERRRAALSAEQQSRVREAASTVVNADSPQSTIPVRSPGEPVPMSFSQELLWHLERANPGATYNVPRAVRLAGELDVAAMQHALDALVARHESLRTTLALIDDQPRQLINDPKPVVIERFDVSDRPPDRREDAAREYMRETATRPFDLANDSLLRVAIIRLDEHDHILQLVSHHVASDGWTGNVLMRDLSKLYEGFRTGTAPALPVLPVQYADFSVWQRRQISGGRRDALLNYWREHLSGANAQPELPTDRPRTPTPNFDGANIFITLPPDIAQQLNAFARSQGASAFMVLLTTLYTLIARYTGEEEIIVGTPIAGRQLPELEHVVGYFANTLLLRTSVGGAPTFAELLQRVRATTLGAYDHQDIPLEALLDARKDDGRPVVTLPSVMFSTEDPDRESLTLGSAASTRVGTAMGTTKFDLQLLVAERPEGLRVAAEFRTVLFDGSTIERLLGHFGTLLTGALTAPDTSVFRLPMLTERERKEIDRWNSTDVAYPEDATLVSLMQEQVAKTAGAVAVADETQSLTYGEFDRATTRLAQTLRDAGVRAGSLVGICAYRSVELVIALHAVVKAGGAYVPVDPDYPADRLSFMLEDANVQVLLSTSALSGELPVLAKHPALVLLDDVARPDSPSDTPLPAPMPDDPAYMIYTSGSTGRPKGALNAHRGIVNRLLWMQDEYKLTSADIVIQKTPFSFDVSVWEFFWPLLTGAKLVMARPGGHKDPDYMAHVMATHGVTVCHFVPSMLRAFLSEPAAKTCTTLRHVIASGEALSPAIAASFYETLPNARLQNLYGPTECAVDVTNWECPPSTDPPATVPIGRPIANTQIHLLDAQLQPVPVGIPGELYIAGVQVGMGYHKRPELTAERFVVDHLSTRPNARMYRTGDSARWRTDGAIEYIGRLDFQVKLRGNRIELGEIETALMLHATVADAIVMVREDNPGDQRLVAYVVATRGTQPAVDELRESLRATLPEIMIPSAFVFLDFMPLTASGKADRKALPVPKVERTARSIVAPRSTIEHELSQIWTKLLEPGRPVSVFDDFFEIGGHSLLAIRMLAEIERVRGQRVPLAWLFEASTIDKLAARLSEQMTAVKEPPLVVLQGDKPGQPIAFVHGDWTGGGWYVRRLAPLVAADSPFYVLPTLGAENDATPWTIESMAAKQISELQKVQPQGPYRIVGFCIGGIVAFEMARQLRDAGHTVERLILIDSSPMNARLRNIAPVLRLVPGSNARQKLERRAALLRRLRWADTRISYFNNLSGSAKSRWVIEKMTRTLPRIIRQTAGNGSAPHASTSDSATAVIADGDRDAILHEAQSIASSAYLPGDYQGAIEFCWAQGAPGTTPRYNPIGRWELVAREVHLTPIASGHIGLITNNLPLLADALRQALNGR